MTAGVEGMDCFRSASVMACPSPLYRCLWSGRSFTDRCGPGVVLRAGPGGIRTAPGARPLGLLGVDLADKARRLDEQTMQQIVTIVDQWVTPEAVVYVEVAGSVASAFHTAAAHTGGWEAPADRHSQPGDRFAHSENAVEGAYAWLMGEPMPSTGH